MPKTCENWLSFVFYCCIYYACQIQEIYQVLPALLGGIQSSWSFQIHWVRQYLVNIVLFEKKKTVNIWNKLCP